MLTNSPGDPKANASKTRFMEGVSQGPVLLMAAARFLGTSTGIYPVLYTEDSPGGVEPSGDR
jgi:hypothetical protein